MKKLKYFLLNNWKKILFFIFICICFFLTNKYIVKADTYSSKDFTAQLYDNYGPTLSAVTTNNTGSYWTGHIPTMVANSAGSAWGVSSPIPLLANHTYTLSLNPGSYIGNIVLSTFNRIGVGSTMADAKASYENGGVTVNYSKALGNGYLQYAFTPSSAGSFIIIPFATDSSGNDVRFDLYNVIIEDLGSGGVSQSDINNSLNNQTNIIQNSINDMENSINDNIKDNFNICRNSYNELSLSDTSFTENGLTFTIKDNIIYIKGTSTAWTQSLYIPIQKTIDTTYTITSYLSGTTGGLSPKLSYSVGSDYFYPSLFGSYTVPANAHLIQAYFIIENGVTVDATIKLQLEKGTTSHSWELPGKEVCKNRLDGVQDSVNDVNDTLKDDNIDTSKTTIEDKSADASNSPISSLLTLPLKLLNNIHTGLSGTCSALNLGSLLGTDLVLPCVNLEQRLGSYLWGLIDYAFCIFLIYNVGMLAVKIWTDVIMMRDFFSELYKPQGEKGGKDK